MKKTLLILPLFSLFFYACHSQKKQKITAAKTDCKSAQQPGNKNQPIDSANKNTRIDYLNEIP